MLRGILRTGSWTASALQWAWRAIELAGPVEDLIVADDRSARGQRLGRRTNVDVLRFVELEVGSRECSIGALGFVPDRDVGRDPLGLDQPIQRGGRPVGTVGGEPLGFEPEAVGGAFDHSSCSADFGLA